MARAPSRPTLPRMAFMQIQSFTIGDVGALQEAEAGWLRDTEGRRTLRAATLYRDRDQPNRYVMVAEFDSYESAMVNSNLPETGAIARELGELVEGEVTYLNLDLVQRLDV